MKRIIPLLLILGLFFKCEGQTQDSTFTLSGNGITGQGWISIPGLILWSDGRIDIPADTVLAIIRLMKAFDSLNQRYWELHLLAEDIIKKLPNPTIEKERNAYIRAVRRYYDFVYPKTKR